MRVNKLEGIKILQILQLPTVKLIDLNTLLESDEPIAGDLSIRLSPKKNTRFSKTTDKRNVFLPSIHNITNKEDVRSFSCEYSTHYDVFAHQTVKPELIGTASRLESYTTSELYMDTYKDWNERHRQIIHNGISIPVYGDRYFLCYSKMINEDEGDYRIFIKAFVHLRKLHFKSYNVEYAIEKGNLIFSELVFDE